MKKTTLLILILIFSLFGVAEAGLLTAAKYNDAIAALCGEDSGNSCNTVQNSRYGYLFASENKQTGAQEYKFPITLAGIFFYAILFIMSYVYFKNEKSKQKTSKKFQYALFIIGTLGVIFSAVFTWIQAYLIEAFCTYCLISAINTVILLILIIKLVFCKKLK